MPSAEKILELPDIAEAAREPAAATVARFEIRYSRFLDPKGKAVRPLPEFAADRAELVALYRAMVLARIFDAKAVRSSEQVDSGPFLRRWVRKRWLSGLPQQCARTMYFCRASASTARSCGAGSAWS